MVNPPEASTERPPEIWIALVIMVLVAALNALAAALFLRDGDTVGSVPAAIAVIYLVLAVFLFRGAAWARYGVIAVIALSLTLGIVAWVTRGDAPSWITLTQVVLLILMFARGVARWTSRPAEARP